MATGCCKQLDTGIGRGDGQAVAIGGRPLPPRPAARERLADPSGPFPGCPRWDEILALIPPEGLQLDVISLYTAPSVAAIPASILDPAVPDRSPLHAADGFDRRVTGSSGRPEIRNWRLSLP